MTTTNQFSTKFNRRTILSTLWIVLMINMLKADILGLFIPGTVDNLVEFAGDTPVETLMLGGAIMMEICILMVIFAQILPYKINRWANIGVAIFTIIFVIGGGSWLPHYIFVATVEIILALIIIWFAWNWKKDTVM